MAIVPYRENPNHVDAERPATPSHDHMNIGACDSDLWWWEPTRTEYEQWRREYRARQERRIRPGFYTGEERPDASDR